LFGAIAHIDQVSSTVITLLAYFNIVDIYESLNKKYKDLFSKNINHSSNLKNNIQSCVRLTSSGKKKIYQVYLQIVLNRSKILNLMEKKKNI
jgi:hypothetical protein